MQTIRMLLVDDSSTFLDSAADFLSRHARLEIVGRAENGSEGVRLARELSPHLVLMDMAMPVMNGLLATRYIKLLPRPPHVVIVSLHDQSSFRLNAAQAGADGFIPKDKFGDMVVTLIDSLFPIPEEDWHS